MNISLRAVWVLIRFSMHILTVSMEVILHYFHVALCTVYRVLPNKVGRQNGEQGEQSSLPPVPPPYPRPSPPGHYGAPDWAPIQQLLTSHPSFFPSFVQSINLTLTDTHCSSTFHKLTSLILTTIYEGGTLGTLIVSVRHLKDTGVKWICSRSRSK